MNSNYIDCPDGGWCGHRKHRPGTSSYKKCLERSIRRADNKRMRRAMAEGTAPAIAHKTRTLSTSMVMRELMTGSSDNYEGPENFVTSGMKVDEERIQSYISTGNTDGVIKDSWKRKIKSDIKSNLIEEVAEETDLLNGYSDSKINELANDLFDDQECTIAMAIASNNEPRTFIHYDYDAGTITNADRARSKAMAEHEPGSDDWYDTIAGGYLDDMMSTHLTYSSDNRQKGMDEDRQAIASALKEYFSYDGDYAQLLPEVSVAWTGNLRDVAPRSDEPDEEQVSVTGPHLVLIDPEGEGPVGKPVRLSGTYSITIPERSERRYGAESGIVDDMTAYGPWRYFDYPDKVGLERLAPEKVTRSYR